MTHHFARIRRFRLSGSMAMLLLTAAIGHQALAQVTTPTTPTTPMGPAAGMASPAQDIREIRGPKPVLSPWLIPLIALSSVLAGAAGWAAWSWYRRRPGLFMQTPLEIALARLEYARGLMTPELGRDFSIEVSSAVREFIESRFQVMAAHLTTHEFLHDLLGSADPLLANHETLLAEFLKSCDLAKFGGWNLSPEEMETMLATAQRFIVASAAEPRVSDRVTPAARRKSSTSVAPRETYDSLPST